MNWTDEQKQTIETTGRSILVSAAAGSGKTTVLVERIKNLMINEGTDIDRFLITTFTNAAAAEMKERLSKALREEMKKPGADKAMLTRQLSKLPNASIGTFHSFAFQIIRQYFYLIDLEPGLGVADDVQIEIMKQNAIDNVFARRYEENTEEFRDFILKYSGSRNDRRIRENVLETCRTLSSIHNGVEWAYAKAGKLDGEHPLEDTGAYRYFAAKLLDGLAAACKYYGRAADLANAFGFALCYGTCNDDLEKLETLTAQAASALECPEEALRGKIEELRDAVFAFTPGRMNFKQDGADEETKKPIENARKAGKAELDSIKKDIYGRSFDELEAELRAVSADTRYYIGIIKEYYEELKELKDAACVLEFDDALHYAIDILDHEEAAAELREKFEYIFVDEYQDSNYLQEEIVGRIAREDNLFMVGDIKQCIYKFRLAEPEIFRSRADVFAKEETPGLLLNISSNFRSKWNVTDSVNRIFREVMPGYDEDAELHCTAGEEHLGFAPRIHLILKEEFEGDVPEKNDAEGAVIAGIIRERLGTEIYDTKLGQERRLQLRDFAVIVRNNKEVEDIERYLINEGIAAYGESGGKYFETVEVQVFINLLRIIENMRQDVPLISAMRSVVFGFTVRELAEIRIACRDGSFSDAVFSYAAEGPDDSLKDKINGMIRKVDLWKEISRTVPLGDLMKEILYGTGYYDYCSGLPVGKQRISNLRLIEDKATKFEEMSHTGLYGFLRYIESMESSDKTDSEAKTISEGEDVVRVMSVHKSKGLEFPVVIFANASKGTDKGDRSGRIKIHRDHGIGLPVVNREQHWHRSSILQKMILNSAKDEMIEEEIRILYVALTRAKDGLEIVGTVKDLQKLEQEISTKSFLEMLYLPLMEKGETELVTYTDAEDLEQRHQTRMHTADQLRQKVQELNNAELEALTDARLSYEYPHQSEEEIKPKYSVTELNRVAAETPRPVTIEAFNLEDVSAAAGAAAGGAAGGAVDSGTGAGAGGAGRALTAAQRGTVMHLLMEKVDFAKAASGGRDYMQSVADILLADDAITTEEYDSLDIDNAAAFFETELGQRAAEAAAEGRLRKEKEFIFKMEMAEDASTIVQGVIDCFFGEDDGIVLIDYKNSYMGAGRTADDIKETYAAQIDLYSQALEGATGRNVKEAYLFLFDTGQFVRM